MLADLTCIVPETFVGQRTMIGYRVVVVEMGLVVEVFGAAN